MMLKSYQRGALLIAAIVLVVIITALVTAMGFLSVSNVGASGNNMSSAQAFFIARSGLEWALYQFGKGGTVCGSLASTKAVGTGSFTISGTLYPTGATSTLKSGINATATIIPVNSIANYAPHGRIKIELEEIDYSSTSTSTSAPPAGCGAGAAPCFIAFLRGANVSTAAAHAIGVAVSQDNQCLIRSTGTAGVAQRILEEAVKL